MLHVDMEDTPISLGACVKLERSESNVAQGTFLLLKVVMTLSALCLSTKTISAMTVGVEVMILQLCISPALGTMADSISAAVVPGAKLLPITTYGPARPRMLSSSLAPLVPPFCKPSYERSLCLSVRVGRLMGLVIAELRAGALRGVRACCRFRRGAESVMAFGNGVADTDLCEAYKRFLFLTSGTLGAMGLSYLGDAYSAG